VERGKTGPMATTVLLLTLLPLQAPGRGSSQQQQQSRRLRRGLWLELRSVGIRQGQRQGGRGGALGLGAAARQGGGQRRCRRRCLQSRSCKGT